MEERRITCREIIIFIAKFKLWDFQFGSNIVGLTFVKFDIGGYTESIYTLCEDGNYIAKTWRGGEEICEGEWEVIEEGNMFDWKELLDSTKVTV